MAKISSNGHGKWGDDEMEIRTRRVYDTYASDKRGHSVHVTFRWTDEDAAILHKIVNSRKSPEFETSAEAIRGLLRDAMKTWFLERNFPENSLHNAIKLMFKEIGESSNSIILRKMLAKKVELFSKNKSPSEVRISLKRIIKNLPVDDQEEIYENIGKDWETGKITKSGISDILESLKNEKWMEDKFDD